MPVAKISHVSDADHARVSAAVAAAEEHTSGEIVTIVTDRSHSYADIALLWAGLGALLAMALVAAFPGFYMDLYDRISGGWNDGMGLHGWLTVLALFVMLKWLGIWLILLYKPLRLALTPGPVKARRVRARAIQLFRVAAQAKTVGQTGVLLYLSMDEHRADIVADAAIADKVSPEVWGDAMAVLIERVRAGQPGEGMAEAVARMGAVLSQHFPKGDDMVNELPDRLIEL